MTPLQSLWLAVPLALPGFGFMLGMTIGRGSLVAGIAGSSMSGAATGAYVAAAAADLTPALDPAVIAVRGGALGFGIGLAVGVVLAAVLFAWRASRPAARMDGI
ncbi:MAG: hypothetical protein OEM23_00525 [Gemmatimonadota bacterium]|nr:hypothetical protein [Gemmatimonadota bacterium]